jgi:hypothetical protein
MTPEAYQLLTALVGGLIPALLTTITTIITLRAKRSRPEPVEEPRATVEPVAESRFEHRIPGFGKRRFRKAQILILIGAGCAAGFVVGTMTKKSPTVVRMYNAEAQRAISQEQIIVTGSEIQKIEEEKRRRASDPALSEPERQAIIRSFDRKIEGVTTRKAEFEEIAREAREG